MRTAILGGGAVGGGLTLALARLGHPPAWVWTRSHERAADLARMLGREVHDGELPSLTSIDIAVLCVSDRAIEEVGDRIAETELDAGTAVVHTSGCLPGDALGARLAQTGAHLGSLHPLVALPDARRAAGALPGAVFAVEGDAVARERAQWIVEQLGARGFEVAADAKARYHAAAVLASNLTVALFDLAEHELREAGVSEGRDALLALTRGALDQVEALGAAGGLTGPAKRGDLATLERHLDVLGGDAREVYRLLSRRAVELGRRAGSLDPELAEELLRGL